MKLNDEIFPGRSLGGIALDEHIDTVLERLSSSHGLTVLDGTVVFDKGLITLGYGKDGLIYSVMCNADYFSIYQNKLWAGMSVADVLANTKKQAAYGGCRVVDGIQGIGLPLPPGLDDFERVTDFLSTEHRFDHLAVFKC